MNFSFNDEQRMLADTAAAFLAEVADSAHTRRAMSSEEGFNTSTWRRLCTDMYWQGILVPEANGGLELGFVELAIALEKAGERLHASPLTAVAAATVALRLVPDAAASAAILESIVEGSIVSLAHTDARPNWQDAKVAVTATSDEGSFCLQGEARFVPFGHVAETLMVVANLPSGLGLFAVPANTPGVVCARAPTMDQTRAMASLTLSNVTLPPSACLNENFAPLLPQLLDALRIMIGAEQVGCAQASLDISVEYVKERVQFGRTIASFQAVKHKAADMMLKAESARSLLYYAACIADEWLAGYATPEQLTEAAAMLSSCAGDAAFFNAGTGIQLHGGVGITEEYDIQLYFKRARSTENYLGSPADMRELIAQQLLDGD